MNNCTFSIWQALQRAANTDLYDKRWQKLPDADEANLVAVAVRFTATGIATLQAGSACY